ncbi:MAG: glycosyltransferase family 4 protein [Gemmatimonadota bacterium]
MRPLHILLVHQLFITQDQAGGTRHFELACHWLAAGHRVTVLAGGRSYLSGEAHAPDPALPAGLTVLRIGTLPFARGGFLSRVANFVAFMVLALWKALQVSDVDVVLGTTPPLFQALAARVAAQVRGVPFVLEVRDLWPDFAVELGALRNPWATRAARALERGLYQAADHVVVNSPGFLGHVRERGARRVSVVPNGVDADLFDPEARGAAFRSRHGLEERFVILYAGAHGVPNDLNTVLDAAAQTSHDSNLVWLLVGDGRDKRRLADEAASRGLENVRFLPPVSKSAMPEVVAAADAGLAILAPLPLFRTVYPNKVFDYLAAGRPVLLAIDGAIRELVEASGGGCYVPPGDPAALAGAALDLAASPDRGRALGGRGRDYVERHFRRADQAALFLGILEEEVAAGAAAVPVR